MVPLALEDGVLEVGMTSPENLEAREALQFISSNLNIPFKIFLISRSNFNTIMKEYQGLGNEMSKALNELESALQEDTGVAPTKVSREDESGGLTEDAPITKMVAVILRHAVEGKASDVHIEPSHDR